VFSGTRETTAPPRGRERLRQEVMPIEPLALDREKPSRLHFARVDDDGGNLDVAALDERAADHGGELGEGQAGAQPPSHPQC
jgi:hypothetical protein